MARPSQASALAPAFRAPSSSLNLVERWFKELTDRHLRRGAFTRVPALDEALEIWTEHWNDNPDTLRLAQGSRGDHREGPPRTSALHQIKSATHH
jgi:hypothetical protein